LTIVTCKEGRGCFKGRWVEGNWINNRARREQIREQHLGRKEDVYFKRLGGEKSLTGKKGAKMREKGQLKTGKERNRTRSFGVGSIEGRTFKI